MILMTPLQYDFVPMMERVVIYFHHLEYARFERDTLLLEWSIGTIRIRGPKAEIFFDKFANHQATSVSADGKDIESITMRLKTDEAVEEAFAAIGKLTDADLNIDDESEDGDRLARAGF